MDLGVSAGFRFAPTESFSIGLSAIYRRTLENFTGNKYGVKNYTHYILVDFGGFYGSREIFEDKNGHVAVGDYRPMFNNFYGGSLQIAAGNKTKIFNEITFLLRNGYFGKKSSSTVTFTEHNGSIIEYNGVLTVPASDALHRIGLDVRYESLDNNKNIYKLVTPEGSMTQVEYVGAPQNVLKRTDISGALSYSGYTGIKEYRPLWEYGIKAEGWYRMQTTSIFPFIRNSSVAHADARIWGTRNILDQSRNMFTIGLEGLFSMGFGNPKEDTVLASTTSDPPRSMDLYLDRDFEYKTAMQAGGCLRLRYTRFFGEKIAFYVEAKDCFTHLLKKPEFLTGSYRNILDTKIGITF